MGMRYIGASIGELETGGGEGGPSVRPQLVAVGELSHNPYSPQQFPHIDGPADAKAPRRKEPVVVRVPHAFVPIAPIPVDGHAKPSPLLGGMWLLFAHGRPSKNGHAVVIKTPVAAIEHPEHILHDGDTPKRRVRSRLLLILQRKLNQRRHTKAPVARAFAISTSNTSRNARRPATVIAIARVPGMRATHPRSKAVRHKHAPTIPAI